MSHVEFENEKVNFSQGKGSILYSRFQASNEPPGLVRWLIRHGIVKSVEMANKILLAVVVVFLIASVYFFYQTFHSRSAGPSLEEQKEMFEKYLKEHPQQ